MTKIPRTNQRWRAWRHWEVPKTNWGPTTFSGQLWWRHWRLQKLTKDQQLSQISSDVVIGGSKNQLKTNKFLRSVLMTSLEAPKTNWGPTTFSDQFWWRHWRLQKLTKDQQLSQISSDVVIGGSKNQLKTNKFLRSVLMTSLGGGVVKVSTE